MRSKRISSLGFTMIELIMVMGIIAVIATMFVNTYPASQRRARDTQRRSDLNQYAIALETYAVNHGGLYPGRNGGVGLWASDQTSCGVGPCYYLCSTDLGLSGCPADPRDGQTDCYNDLECKYWYQGNNCNNGSACATEFVLRGRLENEEGFWTVCSNGVSDIAPETTNWDALDGACPF